MDCKYTSKSLVFLNNIKASLIIFHEAVEPINAVISSTKFIHSIRLHPPSPFYSYHWERCFSTEHKHILSIFIWTTSVHLSKLTWGTRQKRRMNAFTTLQSSIIQPESMHVFIEADLSLTYNPTYTYSGISLLNLVGYYLIQHAYNFVSGFRNSNLKCYPWSGEGYNGIIPPASLGLKLINWTPC